ncbi:MAG: FGGY family carbohydrate kinase [Thermofilaceae archaeon]
MPDRLIAVLDVGKTNKKFTVYTEQLQPLFSTSTRIGEISVEGILCDDAEAIVRWARAALAEWAGRVSAIAVTTHGATLALLDERGELAMPVVSYNHEVGEEVKSEFYARFGSPEELYIRTGTPPLGQLLNAGVQLFWISTRFPDRYRRARKLLFLPQYIVHALSNLEAAELTSIGCHTYLWDLVDSRWSSVAEGLDAHSLSPGIRSVWEPLGRLRGAVVTPGIHDSNAALLPYLAVEREEFVLASTGTWCVLMYPGAPFAPEPVDMSRDILYYVDAYGRPVKAARFKIGFEFDYYVEDIRRRFGAEPLKIALDESLAVEVLKEARAFYVPTLTPGTGQFPRSKGRLVGDPGDAVRAYYYLNLSLAVQTWYALNLLTDGKGVKVYVQGGFARNDVYLSYLSTLLRNCEIVRAENPEATSLGAAVTALCALEGVEPRGLSVEPPGLRGSRVKPLEVEDRYVEGYVEKFLRHCAEQF